VHRQSSPISRLTHSALFHTVLIACNTRSGAKKKAVAGLPMMVGSTQASSAQSATSGEHIAPGKGNYSPVATVPASVHPVVPAMGSPVLGVQDPGLDANDIRFLECEYSTCLVHMSLFIYLFLVQLLAARDELRAAQEQAAGGPSRALVPEQAANVPTEALVPEQVADVPTEALVPEQVADGPSSSLVQEQVANGPCRARVQVECPAQ